MPSTPFASVGFAESGDYYFHEGEMLHGDAYAAMVEQYGEDDAKYIWDAMHPKLDGQLQPIYFIHTVSDPEILEQCRAKAQEEGREFRELQGSLHLLRRLLSGSWNEDEFLILQPGQTIRQTGDWDRILRAD